MVRKTPSTSRRGGTRTFIDRLRNTGRALRFLPEFNQSFLCQFHSGQAMDVTFGIGNLVLREADKNYDHT
ncbi:hypothetical protein BLNAU_6760 [Blattamonas nauphoetae]|uniref:Uncharacterized protein n=1 Tax=Blattamonas nauphoetae TaxID=2049346 RepID=A0ABQ9Y3F2_9EUKA|nr:hypothetical protein BLNAU_6760 [Blattamonas nauphoetae]